MEEEAESLPAINARLVQVRQALGLNQEAFASLLGLSRSYLGNIESGRRGVSTDIITLLIESKQVSAHWLLTGQGAMLSDSEHPDGNLNGKLNGQVNGGGKINHVSNEVNEPPFEFTSPRAPAEIILATQDTRGNPTYTVVNHKAAANYRRGYLSQEFIEGLGAVTLPRIIVGSSRQGIFYQIEGESMTPRFNHDDWVACTLLDRSEWRHMRDNECYVIVSEGRGIQFKRIKNRLNTPAKSIQCTSDNRHHGPYNIHGSELLQVFQFVLHVSTDSSNPDDTVYKKVDHLEDITSDLRIMYEQMQDQIRALRDEKKPQNGHEKAH